MRYYVILISCPNDPTENELRLIQAWSEMSAHKHAEKEFNERHAFPKNMIEYNTVTQFISFSKRQAKAYGDGFFDGVNLMGFHGTKETDE